MLFSAVLLLSCMWTSTLAGNDSNALNANPANVSTAPAVQIPSMIISHLPKAMRTKSNQTLHTASIPHSKVKVNSVEAKHNKVANVTTTSKLGVTTLPAVVRNLKNGDHRSNSSRLLDRLASISKVSLASLASSKISNPSNKTSAPRNERTPVNITLTELKNATNRANSTIAKRSVHNSTVVDRASSFFQSLPVVLVNTTSNVTSWVRRLFSPGNNASTNVTTKKVTRDTSAAELKSLLNSSQTSKSPVNLTVESKAKSGDVIGANEEEKRDLGNNSSILNLTVSSSVSTKQNTGNKKVDLLTTKGSNSSLANATKDEIKRDDKNSDGSSHRLNVTSLPVVAADDGLSTPKLNDETPGTTENASLVVKSLESPINRTRRHNNPVRYGRPAEPQYMMPTTPAPSYQGYSSSAPYPPAAPVYGMAAAALAYGMTTTTAAPAYGMAPAPAAPAYGMAPAAPAYGMAPAPAAPAYGMAPAPVAPAYGMAPAPAAPSYGMAPAAVTTAPAYGMAPAASTAAPAYGTVTAAPAPAYGMAPAAAMAAPAYGMVPVAPSAPTYGMAPAAPSAPTYGMAPAAPASPSTPANGMALAAPMAAPAYGMAPAAPSAPANVMALAAPMAYGMPATTPSYGMQTESYYTAPQPTYTTGAPYSVQSTTAAYAPAPVSSAAQPYGGSAMPSRPSVTASPWL